MGPDGRPTPEFLAWTRHQAEAGEPEAMANHGLALHQEGRAAEGVRWLERAWAAGNAAAGFNLGTLLLARGDSSRAEQIWREAAGLGDVDAMVGLARQALGRGDLAAAEAWVDPVLAQDDPFPITALALAFMDSGQRSIGARAFNRAAELGYPPATGYAAP